MGLYVQREALVAAQKSLDITGNNISNITTKGYSRQRVDVCSVANTGYNLMYNTSTSLAELLGDAFADAMCTARYYCNFILIFHIFYLSISVNRLNVLPSRVTVPKNIFSGRTQ